jgi:gliding motility-associated-like protein
MKIYLVIWFTLIILVSNLRAQTYNIAAVNGQTITTCSGNFTDSNSSGQYSNNENYTVTFCSSTGNPLLFDFSDPISNPPFFDVDCAGDTLYVYNGTAASGTPIAILTNLDDNTQTTYSSQLQLGTTSTCVTFKWKSNGSCTDQGWSASISCTTPPACLGNPPASDIFGQATPICNLNNYCGSTATYYGEDTPFNLIGGGTCPVPDDGIFGGTIENNSWLSFQAVNTTASFNFTVSNCGGGGIQVGIFGFNGTNFNLVSPCALTDGSQGGSFTVNATALTPGSTYYIMIDGNSGSNCNYVIQANTGVAVVNAGSDQIICSNTTTLSANAPAVGVGTWSVVSGSGTFANVNSPTTTVSGLSLGSNVFEWTLPSGLCANVSDNVTINVTAGGPTITVNSATICSGSNTLLTATGATTYSWNTGSNTSTLNVSPTTTTVYTVTGTTSGCTSTKTTTVTVSSTPTISSTSSTICAGGTATLTASGGTSYTWTPGSTTNTTLIVSPGSNTTYTVTGSNGTCTSTATGTVTVSGALSITSNSTSICSGGTATLTAAGATTYTWLPMSTNGSSVTVNPTSNTTYTVRGLSGTCTGSTTVNVGVTAQPTVSVNSATICSGSNTLLTATGVTTYSWNTGANTSTLNVSPTTTTVYTVTGTTNGCASNQTVQVTVIATPILLVSPDVTITKGATTTLTVSGGANYNWSPNSDLSCFNCSNPIASPSLTTQYCVSSSNGVCTTTSCVIVTVESDCKSNTDYTTPNAFTPNGDGSNDEFCLKGWSECTSSFRIAIFDRWGEKVFESEDPSFCWDGKYLGFDLNPAVFVFYIKAEILNMGTITKKGNITLMK